MPDPKRSFHPALRIGVATLAVAVLATYVVIAQRQMDKPEVEKKRHAASSKSTRVLEDLRLIDGKIDAAAIENQSISAPQIPFAEIQKYLAKSNAATPPPEPPRVIMSGTKSYSGATTIAAGVLRIDTPISDETARTILREEAGLEPASGITERDPGSGYMISRPYSTAELLNFGKEVKLQDIARRLRSESRPQNWWQDAAAWTLWPDAQLQVERKWRETLRDFSYPTPRSESAEPAFPRMMMPSSKLGPVIFVPPPATPEPRQR